MDISYLNQYAGRNQLADLTSYTESGKLDVSAVAETTLAGGKIDGKLYAMNAGSNALTMMVDPAMLKSLGIEEPAADKGWTWDEFAALGDKAKAQGKLLFSDLRHDVFFPFYLRGQGKLMYAADGTKLGYDDDQLFIDYYKKYQEWYDKGYTLSLDKLSQSKGTPEEDLVALGTALSSNQWSNQFIGLSAAAKRDLDLLPIPGWDTNKALFLKPSMYFTVANSSKVKDAAIDFINYFINDVEANKVILGERGVPVSSKVQEAIRPNLTPEQTKVFDYVAWAEKNSSEMNPPNPVGAVEVDALLKAEVEKILYKQVTVEKGAAEFREKANAILAKNK
ncbi:ABC transporter substrate-binding protein [Cohnella rhizosphaerae]|uniref:ABC transporter substrate-binding protein n=1 Tax=Cohnella rhizosphaerae TaxID=1457232 RepID=UPI0030B87A08